MINSFVIPEPINDELKKEAEKKRITTVIAPEHYKRHHDHENKMKIEEEILFEQIISHCDKFRSAQLKVTGWIVQYLN